MNQQAVRKIIQDVEGVFKKARKNTTCHFPECYGEPIGSHIIARRTLAVIADKGHVLTWLPRKVTGWDMLRSISAGRPLENLYEKPISVGIRDKNNVTESLFCYYHDKSVFAPLEDEEFSFQAEQVVLLAFRALCSMIFSTEATETIFTVLSKQTSYQYSSGASYVSETLSKLQGLQATKLVLGVRQLYAQIQSTRDYDQLGWSMYRVNIPPCIAATYAFIPSDERGAIAIFNGTQALTVEDAVSFSFLPYKPLNCSVCVISWLRGSQRAQWFMTSHKFNELSEKAQQDLCLSFAFESPTIYIAPIWWQSLSVEKREEYKKIHLDAHRKHEEVI